MASFFEQIPMKFRALMVSTVGNWLFFLIIHVLANFSVVLFLLNDFVKIVLTITLSKHSELGDRKLWQYYEWKAICQMCVKFQQNPLKTKVTTKVCQNA